MKNLRLPRPDSGAFLIIIGVKSVYFAKKSYYNFSQCEKNRTLIGDDLGEKTVNNGHSVICIRYSLS